MTDTISKPNDTASNASPAPSGVTPKSDYPTISRFVDSGACSKEMWEDLGQWVNGKMNILVIGESGSGKESFLEALSGLFPVSAKIVNIGYVHGLELNPNRPFKPETMTGDDGLSISDHLNESLRMNPDIVVIDEVRDQAAYDLMSVSYNQVFSTLHANGPYDAIIRLRNLIGMSEEVDNDTALALIASAFDIIVYVERLGYDSMKVMSISEVASKPEMDPEFHELTVRTEPIWEFVRTGNTDDGKVIGEYRKSSRCH